MKTFHRLAGQKKIAGVCAGLGEYFDIDPVFFRLFFLVSLFFGGLGALIYVLLWIMANVPTQNGHPPAIADSLAGTVGRTIEPVIKPLGFNWKIGIGLITSLAARETIIATLGTIYGLDPEAQKLGLEDALHQDLTPGGAFALLIFFAFAMQCISTIAVVRRETGGWKWPAFQFTYMTVLAYAGAFVAAHLIH